MNAMLRRSLDIPSEPDMALTSSAPQRVLSGRMSHMCAVVGSNMYMVGGYHKSEEATTGFKDRDVTVELDHVNIYSIHEAVWRRVAAKGEVPVRGSGMCMTVNEECIYTFGGLIINESGMREFSNNLHELNTRTMTWRTLNRNMSPGNRGVTDRPSIRDKAAMIYYKKALWVFAGWGTRIDIPQNNSQFVPDLSHEFVGWNNELWRFDLDRMSWSSPKCSGTPPSPRAAHTLTLFSDNKAVLFGGRTRDGRVAELFILNLDTLEWEGPKDAGAGPEPRSLHTCTRLHDGNVMLLGGMNGKGDSVYAQWILKTMPTLQWEAVNLCEDTSCARTWHTTVAHNISDTATELLVFGGSPDNIWQPKHKYWTNMTRFIYGVRPLYDLCLDFFSKQSEPPVTTHHSSFDYDIQIRRHIYDFSRRRDHVESVPILDMSLISAKSAS